MKPQRTISRAAYLIGGLLVLVLLACVLGTVLTLANNNRVITTTLPSPVSGQPIIGYDGTTPGQDYVYLSTVDRSVYRYAVPRTGAPPAWSNLTRGQAFKQPPLLTIGCNGNLLAADGADLYTLALFARDADTAKWTPAGAPLNGAIRALFSAVPGTGLMHVLVGDTRVLYSTACPDSWTELWNNGPVDSNLAIGPGKIMLASNGHIWTRPTVGADPNVRNLLPGEWQDATGNLAGQTGGAPVRFVAFGMNGALAATGNHVFRAPLDKPGEWSPYEQGLRPSLQVQGLEGTLYVTYDAVAKDYLLGDVVLFTNSGPFVMDRDAGWKPYALSGAAGIKQYAWTYPGSPTIAAFVNQGDSLVLRHQLLGSSFIVLYWLIWFVLAFVGLLAVALVILLIRWLVRRTRQPRAA